MNLQSPSEKIDTLLSQVANNLEDLFKLNDLSQNNFNCLLHLTRILRDDSMKPNDRDKKSIDLRNSIDQILNSSMVADQILIQGNSLAKRFPTELDNISFDFRNFKNFKALAIQDALDSIKTLKNHGFDKDTVNIFSLLQIRSLHFEIYSIVQQIVTCCTDLMATNHVKVQQFTKEHYNQMQKELEESQLNSKKLLVELETVQKELEKEQKTNRKLIDSIENVRQDMEKMKRIHHIELEKRDKEIRGLRNVAAQSLFNSQEVQLLKAQLAALNERYENLQMKYAALEDQNDRFNQN